MNIHRSEIDGVFIIEPKVFNDERGYFFETFRQDIFDKNIEKVTFVQENESRSRFGVVRGLHFQTPPFEQSKLVRVISGKILDVAVDIRLGSVTFGKHVAVELSSDNKKQLYIPSGFAHGFSALSNTAVVCYKVDNYYSKEHDGGINPFDEEIGIDWLLEKSNILLSEKDNNLPALRKLYAL